MAYEIARALYAFAGEEASDLAFREDDIIRILKKDESGWWVGQTDDGRRGEFPYNYVELISAAEEDKVRTASRFIGQSRVQQTADNLLSVQVVPQAGQPMFTVEARMNRKMVGNVKSMEDFRKLDEMLKFLYPNFDRPLPPVWADRVYESEGASRKKAKVLEIYLAKMLINTGSGNGLTEYALISWISPRESFNCSKEIKDQVSAAANGAARQNGGRNAYDQADLNRTVLARAEYPWDQKDAVELPLQVGSLIAVRNQNTYNEGWWEGEDTAGQRGLFPNNYVQMLKPNEAAQVIKGNVQRKQQKRVQPQQFGSFAVEQPKQVAGANRQRKTENNFAIPSLDAFDELLNDGFTMLDNDKLLTKRPNASVPRQGDTVTLSYVAFVWDCQNQKLIEFASSDLPDQRKNVGPLVFQVGSGKEIKGLDRAVQQLETGQSSRVIVTPDLGYGEVGNPPNNVPPNCHLVYDVTLDSFQSSGGGAAVVPSYTAQTGFVPNRQKRQHQPKVQQESNYNFQEGNTKKYGLEKMREIVKYKSFAQHEVNPKFVEDHLTDEAFLQAFNANRTDFMLMQRWKRSKLKQDAGLY